MPRNHQPVIEPATATDIDELVECWLQLASEQRDHGSVVGVESNREIIRDVLGAHRVFNGLLVARASDEIVGFATFAVETGSFELSVSRGLLSNLWVVPDRRDEGIGRRLLEAVEAELADRGVEVCQLEVLAANDAARRFYRRAGYEPRRVTMNRRLDSNDENDTPSKVDG